ncbi:protein of unknown function [Methylotuvimicrobium alcaliphilum 20Z]|uniref:Uncharacterized protein n=1 Tax=Methylotuvimicrobium alcaliphilum (strain DSM 19304 / NCIMB 14124 / VKM B-2133 / 20Z) TaxID=1091494 RepID=G4T072_META2|nr:protein of unknown function [Methylotuvimicrobium alcaliphilum 20Z]
MLFIRITASCQFFAGSKIPPAPANLMLLIYILLLIHMLKLQLLRLDPVKILASTSRSFFLIRLLFTG